MIKKLSGKAAILLSLKIICLSSLSTYADNIIPANRLFNWNSTYLTCSKKIEIRHVIKVPLEAFESSPDKTKTIQHYIDKALPYSKIIIPDGNYNLQGTIRMKSFITLSGSGNTTLNFKNKKRVPAIEFQGKISQNPLYSIGPVKSGTNRISLSETQDLKIGDTIVVYSENDPEVMYTEKRWDTSWAKHSMGQLTNITNIDNKSISVNPYIRLNLNLKPAVKIIYPCIDAGIKNMKIQMIDSNDYYTIKMMFAVNCKIDNINSYNTSKAHIWLFRCLNISVENSSFINAFEFGRGGYGYGIQIGKNTTDSIFQNNFFNNLRHSVVIKEGANGNIIGYNFSGETKKCAYSIHGHYSYMNLFEGNSGNMIEAGDFWGPTGPFTTLFRNRIIDGISVKDHSDFMNIIGNTVINKYIKVSNDCKYDLINGNRIRDKMFWLNYNVMKIPNSLYLNERPAFLGKTEWPFIGADVDIKPPYQRLPAENM